MIRNGKGGGNTKTGLVFEGKTDLATFLNSQEGYRVTDGFVFYKDKEVARIFKKYAFYEFLKEVGIDWTKIISKRLLPDDSIYVIINNTLFIIECKYGIIIHTLSLITAFLPFICDFNLYIGNYFALLTIGLPICLTNAILIYAPALILRYNLPRIEYLYKINLRKNVKHEDIQ